MSGGEFDYLQNRYEWDEMFEKIEYHIKENPQEFSKETLDKFKESLGKIKEAQILIQRIDWLLSYDDGEESFHERLKEDLENLKKETKLSS